MHWERSFLHPSPRSSISYEGEKCNNQIYNSQTNNSQTLLPYHQEAPCGYRSLHHSTGVSETIPTRCHLYSLIVYPTQKTEVYLSPEHLPAPPALKGWEGKSVYRGLVHPIYLAETVRWYASPPCGRDDGPSRSQSCSPASPVSIERWPHGTRRQA